MSRVLVVDADERSRGALVNFLSMSGQYEVSEAATAAAALSCLRQERPRLILLDTHLPDMTGLGVLRQAKAIDPGVGVIMITGVQEEAVGREALKYGASHYITKPLDLQHLNQILSHKRTTVTLG